MFTILMTMKLYLKNGKGETTMKEQLYRFIGNDGEFKKGEILTLVEHVNNGRCKLYSNGEVEEWLYSEHASDVEPIIKIEVGSKCITKCDIYANDGMAKVKSLKRGCILKVVKYSKSCGLVEFNNDVWLNEEEALLLLEPYTEPLKEMTAEQIAKEFNVKVVG